MSSINKDVKEVRFEFILSLMNNILIKPNNKKEQYIQYYVTKNFPKIYYFLDFSMTILIICGCAITLYYTFFILPNDRDTYLSDVLYLIGILLFPLFVHFGLFCYYDKVRHHAQILYKGCLDVLKNNKKIAFFENEENQEKEINQNRIRDLMSAYFILPKWSNSEFDLFIDVLSYVFFEKDNNNRDFKRYFNQNNTLFSHLKNHVTKEIRLAHDNEMKCEINDLIIKVMEEIKQFDINEDKQNFKALIKENNYWHNLFGLETHEINIEGQTKNAIQEINQKLIKENKKFKEQHQNQIAQFK